MGGWHGEQKQMDNSRFYDFDERLRWSEGYLTQGVSHILKNRLPACVGIEKANELDDRNGTDYWALRDNLPPLSIDVKVRDTDFKAKFGQDDLALETWSVIYTKPGWTRDVTKRTDFILWYWQDTGRFFLVSFPILLQVFLRYWERWQKDYKTAKQSSATWKSECVFVPRKIVIEKMNSWQTGISKQQAPNH